MEFHCFMILAFWNVSSFGKLPNATVSEFDLWSRGRQKIKNVLIYIFLLKIKLIYGISALSPFRCKDNSTYNNLVKFDLDKGKFWKEDEYKNLLEYYSLNCVVHFRKAIQGVSKVNDKKTKNYLFVSYFKRI